MHQHDIFRIWAKRLTKTGTEQEKVNRLVDVLDGLLAFPQAKALPGIERYEKMRQQARDLSPLGPGVDMLTDALVDISYLLPRV